MDIIFEDFVKYVRELPFVGRLLEKRPKVAVLRLSGVIADQARHRQGLSYHKYSKLIDKAFEKGGVVAVALVVNSPGGSPAQSALIAGLIRQLSEEKDIPVYAFVEDVAASGGYWLVCAADEIYAQESSIVGSIGVIAASFGFENLIKRYDVRRRVHTSGKDKSFLDPFLPESEKDVTRLKALQKDIHQSFKDWVEERRGDKLKGTNKDLFEGQFWTAGPALEKGLIDGLGDVRSVMQEKFGEKVKLVPFSPEGSLVQSFLPVRGEGLTDDLKALLPQALLNEIEDRALWGRYGL